MSVKFVDEAEEFDELVADARTMYLREIGDHELLTAEEEVTLGQQLEVGTPRLGGGGRRTRPSASERARTAGHAGGACVGSGQIMIESNTRSSAQRDVIVPELVQRCTT